MKAYTVHIKRVNQFICNTISSVVRKAENASAYRAKEGKAPKPLPIWVGNLLAQLLLKLGPKGLEFGRYSIDYHFIRNWLYVNRNWSPSRAQAHIPEYAKRLVAQYNQKGEVSARCDLIPMLVAFLLFRAKAKLARYSQKILDLPQSTQ